MSLINQVLRDLDARHAPAVDRAALPGTLHPLPPEPPRLWPKAAAAALVAGGLAFAYLGGKPLPPPAPSLSPAAAPSSPAALPVPQGTAASAPVALPPEVSALHGDVSAGQPAGAALPGPAAETPGAVPVKTVTTAAKVKRADASPRSGAARESAAGPRDTSDASAAADAKSSTAEVAAPASIEKRPRTGGGNEAADAEYRKAMSALRRGGAAEAIDGLRAALRADKRHRSARQALLSLLVEQRQWNEAQALAEEGLALDPAQAGWAMALARLQFEQGNLAEAVATLTGHAAHAEQHADYQAFLALLLHKQKHAGEAAQRYHAALALKPNESRWWYGLGLVLESDQKPQEARAAFLKARETGNLTPDLLAAVEQRLR